jgi:hypothetical protein
METTSQDGSTNIPVIALKVTVPVKIAFSLDCPFELRVDNPFGSEISLEPVQEIFSSSGFNPSPVGNSSAGVCMLPVPVPADIDCQGQVFFTDDCIQSLVLKK